MKKLNDRAVEIVRQRYEENIKSGQAALKYMEQSTAVYRSVPVACLYMPKFFSHEAYKYLEGAAETICNILDKVIQRYLDDPAYRKLFPFPAELEELILIEAHYPRLLPISRLDIFFNEDDFSFQFCEFNADGASAMNEEREITNATQNSDLVNKMREEYEISPFELFDSWVVEFMDIYESYSNKISAPRIIISDFMERATANEFIEFKKAFQRAGYDADICDIKDFSYSGGELKTADGKKVDVVYRRAVTRDIMDQKDEVSAFLQAARDNAVCIIGNFRTQVIHNKMIFKILRQAETLDFLTENERDYVMRHIPETLSLEACDLDAVLKNKEDWILKPEDLYGSRGVVAGFEAEASDWEKAIKEALQSGGYLIQRYCKPYRTLNLDFNKSQKPELQEFNNITGMFVYNAKLAGLYSRAGSQGTISSYAEGRTMSSLLVKEKK